MGVVCHCKYHPAPKLGFSNSTTQGLIGVAITTAVFGALKKAEKHDPLATDEQMSVRRTNSALLGCVGLSAIAIGEFILLSATAAAGFTGIAFVASLAGYVIDARSL